MRKFDGSKRKRWEKMTDSAVVYILNLPDEGMKNLSDEKVAAAVCINKASLSKAFRHTLRISLTGFIKRERLYRALFTLETEPQMKINDLADRLGFSLNGGFEKEFEAFFLITPQKYKKLVPITQ
jgi:AraC-like DNA-binding protein